MALLQIAAQSLQKWKNKGYQTTHYTCPHCKGSVETRKPEANMVPSRGFWQKVKECYMCHGLSIVKTWPNGLTKTE